MGFDSIDSVRVGKYLEVKLLEEQRTGAEVHVKEMCSKLLANPVIEDFRFELIELT